MEFELKPDFRAESPPPPGDSGSEVPSSPFQSSIAHAGPSRRQGQPLAPSPLGFSSQGELLGLAFPSGSEPMARPALPGRTHLPRSRLWPPPSFSDPNPQRPVSDSRSPGPLPSRAPPSLSPSKARNCPRPRAALGPSDQPHYPASRINDNNSHHFTSAYSVPGA